MNDEIILQMVLHESQFQERMAHLGRKELDEGLIRPQLPLCPRSAGHCTLLSRHIEFHTNTQIHTLKNTRKRINTQTRTTTRANTHKHAHTHKNMHTFTHTHNLEYIYIHDY